MKLYKSAETSGKPLATVVGKINYALFIHPNGQVRLAIDSVMVIATLYNSLTVLYRSGFESTTPLALRIVDIIVDAISLSVFVSNFFRIIERGSDLIMERRASIKAYILVRLTFWNFHLHVTKKWFAIDVISIIPVDWFESDPKWRLNRLIATFRIGTYLPSIEKLLGRVINPVFIRIIKSLLSFALGMHALACVWFYFAATYHNVANFLLNGDVDPHFYFNVVAADDSLVQYSSFRVRQYAAALFLSSTYLTGFSSMAPQDISQIIFCILVVLIGAGFFAHIVGTISSLFEDMDQTEKRFNDKLDMLKNYMMFKKINPVLQHDVRNFYSELRKTKRSLSFTTDNDDIDNSGETNDASDDEDNLLDDLDYTLKRDVMHDLHIAMVRKVPLFSNSGEMFMDEICTFLNHTLLLKGYYAVRRGEIGKEMFFIGSGSVEVLNSGSQVIATLEKGSFFGEIALTTKDAKRVADVRAITNCDLYILLKKDFEYVVDKYPEAKESIRQIVEQRKADLERKDSQRKASMSK